jgi:hypothetical protein
MLDRKAAFDVLKKIVNQSHTDRHDNTQLDSVLTKVELDTIADLMLFLTSGWMRQQ